MYCKNSKEYKVNNIPKTVNASIKVFTPDEDRDFIVREVILQNGGSMPNHTNEIQHQQYVLSGEAKVVVGDEVYHAKTGDFLYIPAGINHYYEAIYDMDYKFLCMIPNKPDDIKMIN